MHSHAGAPLKSVLFATKELKAPLMRGQANASRSSSMSAVSGYEKPHFIDTLSHVDKMKTY